MRSMTKEIRHFITEEQAAQILGVSRITLRTWRRRDIMLPYYRIGERTIRYHYKDVAAFKIKRSRAVLHNPKRKPKGDRKNNG